jgi:hypothetical protein
MLWRLVRITVRSTDPSEVFDFPFLDPLLLGIRAAISPTLSPSFSGLGATSLSEDLFIVPPDKRTFQLTGLLFIHSR